jgi:simple sugar transport system substrate-binding protein
MSMGVRGIWGKRRAAMNRSITMLLISAIAATGGLMAMPGSARADGTTIGIILEARASEQPWSAAVFDAIEKLQKADPSIKIKQAANALDPTSAEPVARQMIAEGVNILDLHSFALNDIAHTLSKEYPKIPMSVSSFDPPVQPNLSVGTVSYLDVGYSQCWLMAKLSKSGKIALVGALPIPYATEILKGCQLGAAAANPKSTVLAAYSNSFTNQQATREQVQALVDQGADAIFPTSGAPDSLGGFQFCEQKKVICVGWASEIHRYAPNYGVSSAIIDWTVLFETLIKQSRDGNLSASTFDASFPNHGLIPQPFTGPSAKLVPADVQEAYAGVISDLTNGKIPLPKSDAHPCCE